MKNYFLFICFLLGIFLVACSEKKKKNDFFPVLSYIESQVKDVDTSVYSIIKCDKRDSTWDTTFIRREEFRSLAKDFLQTPDLTNNSIGKKYKEEKIYDEAMNRAILTYTPVKGNPEIIKQEVIIIPGNGDIDKVRSIIIEKSRTSKDSLIQQNLLWQVDEKFQVVTMIEKKGQPVVTKTTEVSWNKRQQ